MAVRVSVIVPSFCRAALLRRAVLSLFAQDFAKDEYEVIVVDSTPDRSNDALLNALASEATCRFSWYAKEPEGPGPSRNLGVTHAIAPVVAFMDSDCFASPGWVRAGLAAFAPGVGLVQGKTLPDPAGRPGVFTWCPQTLEENFVYECTSIFYQRAAIEQAGGFPGDATPRQVRPQGGEDVELAWTVKRLGWKSTFAADALVYHELQPIPAWRWVFDRRMFLWPSMVARFPELRRFFVARCFWDRAHALLALAAAGVALALALRMPAGLILCLPYAILRGRPPSQSFPGPLRPLRILPYLARDSVFFVLLLAGSIRYRTVLL